MFSLHHPCSHGLLGCFISCCCLRPRPRCHHAWAESAGGRGAIRTSCERLRETPDDLSDSKSTSPSDSILLHMALAAASSPRQTAVPSDAGCGRRPQSCLRSPAKPGRKMQTTKLCLRAPAGRTIFACSRCRGVVGARRRARLHS